MVLETTILWYLFSYYHNFNYSNSLFQIYFYTYYLSLDNSEWMRNGDYSPSRLEAQQDAGKLLLG